MRTVFVTGGSGFLGRAMIPALVAGGYQIRALCRTEVAAQTLTALGATPVIGDLSNVDALAGMMIGATHVVHAAARMEQGGPAADYYADNVFGTKNMLSASKRAGVQRFVSIGAAMCLVGGRPSIDADESWPLQQL